MIRQNDYALELFNGDIGLIMEDVGRQGSLAAYFADADGFKKVAVSCLPDFEPAFAMTVHKTQGSEYREVCLLPPSAAPSDEGDDAFSGLSKALLYTAITRAREKFVFFGGEETFRKLPPLSKRVRRHWAVCSSGYFQKNNPPECRAADH